ncbi:MAG: ABC transporter substrate-binding protein [Alphaproteobacteria bacterium]
MRKATSAIAGALALATLAAGPALAADKLKIGFVATLSGSAGLLGKNLLDGFMLGVEEAGGKLGGISTEISTNDDQFKPDVAKQIAEKLVKQDQVDIVTGIVYSNIMMAMYKTVVDAKVILVSENAGPSPIAGKLCSPYFFTTAWQNDQPHAAVAQYMQDRHIQRVFLIASNYQAGQDALAGFKSKFKGTIVTEIYPALGQPDYSVEITEIAAAKPDAVYAFIASGAAVNFVKQYAQAGLMKQIPLYSDFVINATTLPAIGDVAIGARSAAFWTIDLDNEASRHFVEAFRKKYNYVPGVYSAQAYDAARLIDAAVREIGGKVEDREALIKALARANYQSVRGPYKYNNNHFPIQNFYATEIVKDKDGTLIEVNRGVILKNDEDAYHQACPLK